MVRTLMLQSLGVAATGLASIVVARKYGAAGQGYVAQYRSFADLWSSLGLFGFPQAFVYLINTGKLSGSWATRFSFAYVGALSTTVVALTLVTPGLLSAVMGLEKSRASLAFTIIISLLMCGLLRGVALATTSIYWYNCLSISPPIAIVACFAIWPRGDYRSLVWALVVATVSSALFSSVIVSRSIVKETHAVLIGWGTAIKLTSKLGFWSFVQNFAAFAVTAGTYRWLRTNGGSDALVGAFSVSYVFFAAQTLPLTMINPILFNEWSSKRALRGWKKTYLLLSHAGIYFGVFAALFGLLVTPSLTHFVFGAQFANSVSSTRWLMFAGYSVYQNRLQSAAILALGDARASALGEVIRASVVLIPLAAGSARTLEAIAMLWFVGEGLSMIYRAFVLDKMSHIGVLSILGISSVGRIGLGHSLRQLALLRTVAVAPPTGAGE